MAEASVEFLCPQGAFRLRRFPHRQREPLQAWNNADRLLLEAVNELQLPPEPGILVVNDEHGALSVALPSSTLWTDSWLSAEATRRNRTQNHCNATTICWSTDEPPEPSIILMRVPKSLHYFEDQLAVLAGISAPGTLLLAAGVDKHLSSQTASILERGFGPTERRRGRLKARVFAARRTEEELPPRPAPQQFQPATLPFPLTSLSNVFSPARVDPGTSLLLSVLDHLAPVSRAADLACGNGIVGMHLLQQDLVDQVLFSDESAMAIASARENLPQQWQHRADFFHGDGLAQPGACYDLVLLNPPFHLGHVVDEFAGRRLIRQAHDALVPGGSLLLVFNNHLKYRTQLRSLFGPVEELARNSRFTVVRAFRA